MFSAADILFFAFMLVLIPSIRSDLCMGVPHGGSYQIFGHNLRYQKIASTGLLGKLIYQGMNWELLSAGVALTI